MHVTGVLSELLCTGDTSKLLGIEDNSIMFWTGSITDCLVNRVISRLFCTGHNYRQFGTGDAYRLFSTGHT